ncbi:DNA-binding response regulator [Actinoplanes sp. DH11]|uniref:DNA-binding response regulator n=1 Tax=Actinoplanes sp. DH11 TaxID=2857011 RepID=UPI001E5CE2B4|nr:DNA-binding response regulator [Actinoplanes sp. DH11]
MAVRVAVVDPLPMFRHGVTTALAAAGRVVDTPADVVRWVSRRHDCCVFLSIRAESDWDLLRRLSAAPTTTVIALLDDATVFAGAKAVRAGARSVLPRTVSGEFLRRTVEATIDGQSVLPPDVLALLAANAPPDVAPGAMDRVVWLHHLAAGGTVAELADRLGYSERAMYRMLRALYREMGVRTRLEAVLRARESGLV